MRKGRTQGCVARVKTRTTRPADGGSGGTADARSEKFAVDERVRGKICLIRSYLSKACVDAARRVNPSPRAIKLIYEVRGERLLKMYEGRKMYKV